MLVIIWPMPLFRDMSHIHHKVKNKLKSIQPADSEDSVGVSYWGTHTDLNNNYWSSLRNIPLYHLTSSKSTCMHTNKISVSFLSFRPVASTSTDNNPALFLLILFHDNRGFENKEKGSVVADKSCQLWDLYVHQLPCPLSPCVVGGHCANSSLKNIWLL